MTEREMVESFHRAMGLPVRDRPEMPSEAERLLRCRLLLEETMEFIGASGFDVHIGLGGRWELEPNGEPPTSPRWRTKTRTCASSPSGRTSTAGFRLRRCLPR